MNTITVTGVIIISMSFTLFAFDRRGTADDKILCREFSDTTLYYGEILVDFGSRDIVLTKSAVKDSIDFFRSKGYLVSDCGNFCDLNMYCTMHNDHGIVVRISPVLSPNWLKIYFWRPHDKFQELDIVIELSELLSKGVDVRLTTIDDEFNGIPHPTTRYFRNE